MGLYGGSAPDHEVAAGFPERQGERLASPLGKRLAQVVGGRFREADDESAGGGARTRASEAR